MTESAVESGVTSSLKKGYVVTKRTLPPKPSHRRFRKANRPKFVRNVIRSMCGLPPYQKRAIEILKIGGAIHQKKAMKLLKKRLGTHRRAKNKTAQLQALIMKQKNK